MITEQQRQRALSWAKFKAQQVSADLFEARVCIVCHEVTKAVIQGESGKEIAWGVVPVHVASTWMPKARFDHVKHRMRVVSHADVAAHHGDVDAAYTEALHRIDALVARIADGGRQPVLSEAEGVDGGSMPANGHGALSPQSSVLSPEIASTFTRDDYESAVRRAVEYVEAGDIIQVVPSQRLSRPVTAHPFGC